MSIKNERYKEIWEASLSLIQRSINDNQVFSNFFYDTHIEDIKSDVIIISAPNSFAVQVLNRKYIELISEVIHQTTSSNFKVEIVDINTYEEEAKSEIVSEKPQVFISNLISKFTFDNFVVGESNRESYMAAFTTATDPGNFYNPLFIYGKSGLGKTHLVHAIGNYIRDKNPNYKILYKSVDDFVEDVIKAYKESGVESLKELYKQVDVFLLDDVQFLSSKTKSKEVLFSIFNTLINNGKQIVLTSDRPPQDLRDIEDRLVGRFSSGLSVQIKALEYETAYKILEKKVSSLDINGGNIDDEVLKYIAENYSTDVRRLEGALNKILFYSITFNPNTDINMDLVKNTFEVIDKKNVQESLTLDKIKIAVSEYYSISVSQLESKVRTSNVSTARHIAMYLCRKYLDISLNQIGDGFGGKDHTTVINAIEKVEKLLKENPDYLGAIEDLKKLLQIK